MTRRGVTAFLAAILLFAGAVGLPRLRASVSQVRAEPGRRADAHVFADQDAIVEAHLLWGHPLETTLIWAEAVVARSSCPMPFTSNGVQGSIEESRVIEAYAPFGWVFSTVAVDCQGETDRR